jgi:hypothetical protein
MTRQQRLQGSATDVKGGRNSKGYKGRQGAGHSKGTAGTKMLITATSLAATIGVWAALSTPPTDSTQALPAYDTGVQASRFIPGEPSTPGVESSDPLAYLAPLPTLVPEPPGWIAGRPGALPSATALPSSASDTPSGQQVTDRKPLRSVSAPPRVARPAPMAVTQSSR